MTGVRNHLLPFRNWANFVHKKDKHDELESNVDQRTIKMDEMSEMRGTHKEKVCQIAREEERELKRKGVKQLKCCHQKSE